MSIPPPGDKLAGGFFILGRCRRRGSRRNAAAIEIENDSQIEMTEFKDSKDRATEKIKDRTVHSG